MAMTMVSPMNPDAGNTGMKSLDVNRYATKKTIAQGMLDIALLTANASQLKYILQVGRQHEFYILMLSLICVSIGLQILSGLLSLSLNLMNDCKMEDNSYARSVELVGKARVLLSFVVFIDNLFIATFDPTGLSSLLNSDTASVVGILYAVVGGLNINRSKDHKAALILNDLILIGVFLISLINVIISGFGMGHDNGNSGFYDHGKQSTRSSTTESDNVIQGIVCVLLGSSLNINKQQDQRKANVWNNICLIMMVLTVAVNAVISAFDMRDTPGNIVNSTNGATTITLDSSGLR